MLALRGHDVEALRAEAGGHRVQRVPANERRGRVHTSTVTVAVVEPRSTRTANAPAPHTLEVRWFSGRGKGGQHRNRHRNCCEVTHRPSGLSEVRQGRVRNHNLEEATEALARRLEHARALHAEQAQASKRRAQTGTGMRADKTYTIAFQNDRATRHATGARMSAARYMQGHMDALW